MLSLLVGLLRLYARSEALPDCWGLHRKARDHRFMLAEDHGVQGRGDRRSAIEAQCGIDVVFLRSLPQRDGAPSSDDHGELRQRRSGDRIPCSECRTVREPYSESQLMGSLTPCTCRSSRFYEIFVTISLQRDFQISVRLTPARRET